MGGKNPQLRTFNSNLLHESESDEEKYTVLGARARCRSNTAPAVGADDIARRLPEAADGASDQAPLLFLPCQVFEISINPALASWKTLPCQDTQPTRISRYAGYHDGSTPRPTRRSNQGLIRQREIGKRRRRGGLRRRMHSGAVDDGMRTSRRDSAVCLLVFDDIRFGY